MYIYEYVYMYLFVYIYNKFLLSQVSINRTDDWLSVRSNRPGSEQYIYIYVNICIDIHTHTHTYI